MPQTEGFKQQKFVPSQFWSLVVQGQGASKVGFWGGCSPWRVDGHGAVSSRGFSSEHAGRENSGLFSSSHKDTSPVGFGPTIMASFNPYYLLQGPIPNAVILGLRASTNEWGIGDTIQSVTAEVKKKQRQQIQTTLK